MSKITKFFDVYGMKCHSCEVSVEHEINELKGITNVSADHENSMVIVTYDDEFCDDNKIKNAIKNCGFSSRINSLFNEKIYKYVGILIVILGILMMKPSLNFT